LINRNAFYQRIKCILINFLWFGIYGFETYGTPTYISHKPNLLEVENLKINIYNLCQL